MRGFAFVAVLALAAGCGGDRPSEGAALTDSPANAGPNAAYVTPAVCAGCHPEIFKTYQETGMGRSFSAARPESMIEDFSGNKTYYHPASGRYYTMLTRDGKYYQHRHQTGAGGRIVNVVEKEIHYVMGSGNHARTYLHRTPEGKLVELPLGWYSANGGFWAMNPGYDRPDHQGFRRAIPDDCMFCHNSYPKLAVDARAHGADPIFPAELPEGIDCQRCHGPGGDHVEAAGAGKAPEVIRGAIFNPATASPDRQLELCMQCHLESTSRALPYAITRFDREPFSYRPSEPLADYVIHFDYAPGQGPEDHFEIAHAAYRLRKSACFTQSDGGLVCTTCHNPHEAKKGPEAVAAYAKVCLGCHAEAHVTGVPGRNGSAARPTECVSCHMPKRRTDDVVHVVMTDHYIRKRQPNRDLLAPIEERHDTETTAYRGEVALYYPPTLPAGPDRDLYLAVAQVYAGANLEAGIRQLEQAIEAHQPGPPDFYQQLAEAYWKQGDLEAASRWYIRALEHEPGFLPAIRNQGAALTRLGRYAEAIEVSRRAPNDAAALNNLGEALLGQGRYDQAAEALRRSLAIDPDSPEAWNNLGQSLARIAPVEQAWDAWRSAIRIKPDYAPAHNNLANSLNVAGRWPEAREHFIQALRDPRYAVARYNYGTALAEQGDFAGAEKQLADAIRIDPGLADAHLNLGNLDAVQGNQRQAIIHFRNAIKARPGFGRARLNLGVALAETGQVNEALEQFREAAKDSDAEVSALARKAIEQLGQ